MKEHKPRRETTDVPPSFTFTQVKYRYLPNYGKEKLHGDLLEHYKIEETKRKHYNIQTLADSQPHTLENSYVIGLRSH